MRAPSHDIAHAPHAVAVEGCHVAQHGAKGVQVGVQVGDDRYPHADILLCPRRPAIPRREDFGSPFVEG